MVIHIINLINIPGTSASSHATTTYSLPNHAATPHGANAIKKAKNLVTIFIVSNIVDKPGMFAFLAISPVKSEGKVKIALKNNK